jgi:PAT family beta-lactamase induction signal transducer AmpG
MQSTNASTRNPWAWIPTLYLAEGLPNAVVMSVSVLMYKNLGLSNTDIALYTSWLNLPWVIKPLWSPVVDIFRTRRAWIWVMQLIIGAGLAGVALTIPVGSFVQVTLAFLFIVAFSSATHDVAADGFYMLGLTENRQALFVGVRNTFYRLANISAQGGLVVLAGVIQRRTGNTILAWQAAFAAAGGLMIVCGAYHWLVLPRPESDRLGRLETAGRFTREFFATFAAFFRKPDLLRTLAFLLLYRFAEVQLAKVASFFMLEAREQGGLGLATDQVGIIYGTVGVIALLLGGILGGVAVSWKGLRFWLWPMALAINVPDVVYVYLAYAQPENLAVIGACVAVEQFGYGFGFAAYMLYMLYSARGEHRTAHYAICTGFMALSVMLPGMWSGWLQENIGYQNFFWWVLVATIPGFLVTAFIRFDREFGRRS